MLALSKKKYFPRTYKKIIRHLDDYDPFALRDEL